MSPEQPQRVRGHILMLGVSGTGNKAALMIMLKLLILGYIKLNITSKHSDLVVKTII